MFWNIRWVAMLIYICTFIGTGLGLKQLEAEDRFHKVRKYIWYSIICFTIILHEEGGTEANKKVSQLKIKLIYISSPS